MTGLFVLTFLASIPAIIIGLINPNWVLPRIVPNRTRKLSTGVYAGTMISSLFLIIASLGSEVDPPSSAGNPNSVSPASPQVPLTPRPIAATPKPQTLPPTPVESAVPSPTPDPPIEASVSVKGLDFSYQADGIVKVGEEEIVVTHIRNLECGPGAPVAVGRQEWRNTFDLTSKSWVEEVRETSNCSGIAQEEWISFSSNKDSFTVESDGNQTVIRSDALDSDGSLLVEDALIIRYSNP